MASSLMHVVMADASAEHRPVEHVRMELRWNGNAVLLTRDGVAHNDLSWLKVYEEDEAMAAPDRIDNGVTVVTSEGEALWWDAMSDPNCDIKEFLE